MASKLPEEAFEYYAGLGGQRSYQAVAEHYGVTKRAVSKKAKAEGWQQRAAELDAKARRNTDQRIVETLEDMNTRHLRSLRVVQGKALEALRAMSLERAIDAVRALDLAIRQERLIRGEPSDRTAVSVEQQIRTEYERWLAPEDDDVPPTD